jgi:hypothetical protein
LAYCEYSAEDDADLDDESQWVSCNPASPARITVEFIRQEREAMGDVEFARERLCLHDGGRLQAVIPADEWHGISDPKSRIAGSRVFAVDVPPDRSHAAIVAAGEREDGRCHVELVDYRSGTSWVIARLSELSEKWGARVFLDPSAAAGGLMPDLMSAGVVPELFSGREMTQACGRFVDMVKDRRLAHYTGHDDHKLLDVAVEAGRKRTVGEAWAWHRRDTSVDISPLVAATLAVFGVSRPVVTKDPTKRPGSYWGT